MGLFDSVYVDCPHCGKPMEFQSNADDDAYLRIFTVIDAPTPILADVINEPTYHAACGHWVALIDPAFPPDTAPPRPAPRAMKVKAPENPRAHDQGWKWWPLDVPFTFADLEDPIEPARSDGVEHSAYPEARS